MKNKKNKIKQSSATNKFGIANWLTILRIILMVPFIIFMTYSFILITKYGGTFWYSQLKIVGQNEHKLTLTILYWLNIVIFILAMITDFADGHIARKTKTISEFGKIFDPIADKIATSLMLIYLSLMNYTFLPIVILFIIRDILVDGARVYAVKKDIKVSANWWGKIKTIVVSFALLAISFSAPWMTLQNNGKFVTNNLYLFYVNIPLLIGLIFSWISGIIYLLKYLKGISKQYILDIQKQKQEQLNTQDDRKNNSDDKSKNYEIKKEINNSEQIKYDEPFFNS
ncbi:CDP-diacylglycerol--glycerol-3-phosphate 3-phosphatidyltransferase [Metamycoplasma canadense]|uniref:CDP-diacylglycerol--glycerol-3-phosphate 3-phosphatidyltransferase n=1 Tax=Metamycoplasma canadense TaxID=29554 RepID=A0A077LAU4_9BACT|nr:CDP-diacylglycerol--glycerol-3-phosphate 3-phosphatidyltransferase [Metamycoplasma canadense]BAP39324.1 CDP-diacylglycerol-glycerol-3-phosphate [Metamycoplasma canadense]